MIRTRYTVEHAFSTARKALERAIKMDSHHSMTDASGALHWVTPESISLFGGEDSDDDSAYFTDDGA